MSEQRGELHSFYGSTIMTLRQSPEMPEKCYEAFYLSDFGGSRMLLNVLISFIAQVQILLQSQTIHSDYWNFMCGYFAVTTSAI